MENASAFPPCVSPAEGQGTFWGQGEPRRDGNLPEMWMPLQGWGKLPIFLVMGHIPRFFLVMGHIPHFLVMGCPAPAHGAPRVSVAPHQGAAQPQPGFFFFGWKGDFFFFFWFLFIFFFQLSRPGSASLPSRPRVPALGLPLAMVELTLVR